jgi:hypothetical protein
VKSWRYLAAALPLSSLLAQDTPKSSFAPTVFVTMRFDSTSSAQFIAHRFELRVTHADSGQRATTEIELAKQAGAYTGSLVSLGASGAHALAATIDVPDSLDKPVLTLRLIDVAIISDHLSLSFARANLEQQRIAQDEALSALTADFQDAQRQLAAAEELNKAHGNTRMDLARARDRATDLQRRIDLLKRRQALLAGQMASEGPLEETIVLRFGRLEIDSREPGGKAAIEFPGKPPRSH